jgi:hypothetical protein
MALATAAEKKMLEKRGPAPLSYELEPRANSNGILLSGREWVIVGLFALGLVLLAPTLWKRYETFQPDADYRMPFDLNNDYWLYDRYAHLAADNHEFLVLGDSVVWGRYVKPAQTLSHYLNELAGKERFANLGLNGAHPVALVGLVKHYGEAIAGKKVVLHYNPLWMKDPSADLQEKDSQLNHPDLVPQFFPSIPSNKASASDKIGRVVDRNVPFAGWNSHLQQAYFGRGPGDDPGPFNPMSIPRWTLEHAYANPVRQLTRGLPPPDDTLHEDPVTWTVRGIKVQRLPWVAPADSLEWSYFQRAVDLLQARGNRVFVVVGPFNEHALTKPNRQDYERIKKGLESWLQERNIPHVFPALLPSDTFADLSHPLSAGYQILARELSKNEFFR